MELPVWGIAVIALYSLLQIPAVLFVARYCEVDAEDLPTPPMRAHWRGRESNDEGSDVTSTEAKKGSRAEAPAGADTTPDSGAGTTGGAKPDRTAGPDAVRCRHCGTANDPSFARCRHCVERL